MHRQPGRVYHSLLIFASLNGLAAQLRVGEGVVKRNPKESPRDPLCTQVVSAHSERAARGSVGYYRSLAVNGLIMKSERKIENSYVFLPDSACSSEFYACCIPGALDNYRIALLSEQMLSEQLCRASRERLISQLSDE